ncbi:hypothetical protein Tco_0686431 [Tanacetum coccineum]
MLTYLAVKDWTCLSSGQMVELILMNIKYEQIFTIIWKKASKILLSEIYSLLLMAFIPSDIEEITQFFDESL